MNAAMVIDVIANRNTTSTTLINTTANGLAGERSAQKMR
jgi:hypothetical protein